ncbi:MAG: hypothetical protein EBY48_06645, partial [Opitutae bacterium]|nr:hypothetical protein [Opitutae bacterium]
MISSKLQTRRTGKTRFFNEVALSCTKELEQLGFSAQVYLIPGGVGVRFLEDSNLENIFKLSHLPIREIDFSRVSHFDPESIRSFPLEALSLPVSCSTPFRSIKFFSLRRLSAKNSLATDFESLAILPIEELSLSGSALEQLTFTHSMPLAKLDLSQTHIQDLRPLSEKNIESLNLQGTNIDS